MDICTVFDHKYLLKGLALYQSLKNTMGSSFTLHVLCIDDIAYQKLTKAGPPANIVAHKLSTLENIFSELRAAKLNPGSKYGNQYSQYCWTLVPWFINYLLKQTKRPLLYADSDIYFYRNPLQIVDAVLDNQSATGIHTQRFSGSFREGIDVGWYNVGVMVFNNSQAALNISETWKQWLLDPENPFYKTHGTCGDQKYLELFRPFFGQANTYVFDEEGQIFHMAPWCPENPENKQPHFYHFSHFKYDLADNVWSDSDHGEWNPSSHAHIKPLYNDYFETIKNVNGL